MSSQSREKELIEVWGEEVASSVLAHAPGLPDPELFILNCLKLLEAAGVDAVAPLFLQEKVSKVVLPALSCSEYLSGLLAQHPECIEWLFGEENYKKPLDGDELKEEITDVIGQLTEEEDVSRFLRNVKGREIVRIGIRDLAGMADMEETTAALSDLAESSLSGATLFSLSRLKKRFGAPMVETQEGGKSESGFCVLALGKFGGRELNFSSDIDIMYVYESDGGSTEVSGGANEAPGEGITFHQFFIKAAEMVTKLIGEVTADGMVFRVDLRLRPDGSRGPLVNSIRALETYYESWGQTWERAALIKGRPVAGDMSVGNRVMRILDPFVYRKYLDFVTVEEVKELKSRIDLSQKVKKGDVVDVKLGEGGIREIEFFIQSHQLIFGGKTPRLREANSLRALALLRQEGFVSPQEEETIADAYRFLRNLEHRIQMLRGMQTHLLPEEEDLRKVSFMMGYDDPDDFLKVLKGKRKKVRDIFGKLFADEKVDEVGDVSPEVIGILYGDVPDEDSHDLLTRLGFRDSRSASENLELLRSGPKSSRMTQRARNYLRKIAPLLLSKVIETPDPDMALSNIESFIHSIGARTTFYALLSENPRVIEPLVQLFGSSQYLSGYFINNLDLLDVLLRKGQMAIIKSKSMMRKELGEKLALSEHFEDELGILRRYRSEEFLRLGIHKLGGNLSLEEFSFQLSALAEALMEYALFLARREVKKKHGTPVLTDPEGNQREASLMVMGLGKLGGEELNVHSDLDIIFIYSHMGETDVGEDESERKKVTNHEFFAKVAQRFISNLATVTREGYVYKVDMRLRPSGSAGPLVTSFPAFQNYYLKDARIWERQALIKSRGVAADRDFKMEVEQWVSWYVYERPLPEGLEKEIHVIRERMEKELAKERDGFHNLKFGKGGLIDVEFLVQYLQMLHGGRNTVLRKQNTLQALFELVRAGIIEEDDFTVLDEGYRFLKEIELSLRIVHDASVERFLIDDRGIRLLGMPSIESFQEKYNEITANTRRVYKKYIKG